MSRIAPPRIADTFGRRETHDGARLSIGREQIARHAVCAQLARALQSPEATRASLRVEYCLDTDGFWLEPHADIGAKLSAMLIYLSGEPGCEARGAGILDADMNPVASAPYRRDGGLSSIPGPDTRMVSAAARPRACGGR